MDETLPDTLHMTSIYLMILLTSLAIVASGIPVYVCMIGALFLSFFMMQVRGGGGAVGLLWVQDCAKGLGGWAFIHVTAAHFWDGCGVVACSKCHNEISLHLLCWLSCSA
jgi:hypothetical protein